MQENLTTKKRGNPRRYYAMQFYDWLESVKDPAFCFTYMPVDATIDIMI